jgi:biopolymer transport protein ExbB
MQSTGMMMLTLAQDLSTEPQSKSLISYVHDGGFLAYVLVVVSFVAVVLIVRNLLIFRETRQAPPDDFQALDRMLRANDIEGAIALCTNPEHNSFLTRVFGAALIRCSRSPFGFLELRSALEESGAREADRLHRANEGIGIIAAIGPMLGLLGTVIGIIGAFRAIGVMQGAARSNELAVFMSIALVNTALGLIVAIPCTIAFALFRRRVDALVGDIAEKIEGLTRSLEQMSTGESSQVAPQAAKSARSTAGQARPAAGEPRGESRGGSRGVPVS